MERKVQDIIFNRREVLKLAGYGAMGFMSGTLQPFNALGQATSTATETKNFVPDLDISLTAQKGRISLFPGQPTQVWQYRATIHKGPSDRVVELPQSYLGPIIKARRGEKVRIRYTNAISEKSIVHWHGLHVPANMDGHPRYVIPQGKSYLYEFEVKNRAGTYWYHPHPHGRTGPQVYYGLAGLFIVSDDEEQAVGLPSNEYDIPLVIQDRTFSADNQLVYLGGHPMQQMAGFLGDSILVNGRPDFTLPVATRAYRLRLLNGSNSRIYRLAWQDGRPLTVIATDGGLLPKPVQRQYVFLSPGERLEIWADFSQKEVGAKTALLSLAFNAGTNNGGMMMGRSMRSNRQLANGAKFSIFKVNVVRRVENNQFLPKKLSTIVALKPERADNISNPSRFYLTMNHMQWSINGRTFEMENVAEDEIVRLGARQVWEFYNTGGGMMRMMNMPHPIHVHGKQFRVIERSGVRHQGYVDEGWKDTVLLMPGEAVRILLEFDDYPGLFIYHCHNLEHEDMGMMRNYYVKG